MSDRIFPDSERRSFWIPNEENRKRFFDKRFFDSKPDAKGSDAPAAAGIPAIDVRELLETAPPRPRDGTMRVMGLTESDVLSILEMVEELSRTNAGK